MTNEWRVEKTTISMQTKAHCAFNFISLWLSINLNRTLSSKPSHIVVIVVFFCTIFFHAVAVFGIRVVRSFHR